MAAWVVTSSRRREGGGGDEDFLVCDEIKLTRRSSLETFLSMEETILLEAEAVLSAYFIAAEETDSTDLWLLVGAENRFRFARGWARCPLCSKRWCSKKANHGDLGRSYTRGREMGIGIGVAWSPTFF